MQLNAIPINECFYLRDKGYSNNVDLKGYARHRWYEVKEAFSPSLVQYAMADAELSPGDYVFDPFSGSGTSALEAILSGYNACVFEVNPFLSFLASVKVSNINPRQITLNCAPVLDAVRKPRKSNLENISTFCESQSNKKWLFNRSVLRSFEAGWAYTSRLSNDVEAFFRLALIGAAMDNCNAVRDGKCLRYRKNWQKDFRRAANFRASLESRLDLMLKDLEILSQLKTRAYVYTGDARRNLNVAGQSGKRFKLCVTSPPYLNSFDYSDIYRPELFLGKFVSNNEELMSIRLKTLRSHVQATWPAPSQTHFGHLYKGIMVELQERIDYLWDKRIPVMVQAYFEDMSTILRNLRALALPGATVWLVVSTSAYAGVEIPVDLILAELAQREGWYLREVAVLRYLRAAGQHWSRWADLSDKKPKLRESVVILKNTPR